MGVCQLVTEPMVILRRAVKTIIHGVKREHKCYNRHDYCTESGE